MLKTSSRTLKKPLRLHNKSKTIQNLTTKKELMNIELKRLDNAFHFEAVGPSGAAVHIDAGEAVGGSGQGARPMEMIAMGLAGCTVIDFILILKKQRQVLDDIRIKVTAKRYENQTPSPFEHIDMKFLLAGELDPPKVEKALKLAAEKYCSAAEMIKSTARIDYSFEIHDQLSE